MLWHRQAIFESKGDKLSSSAECRIQTQGLRHLFASRLNACWQTNWAIEDQAKTWPWQPIPMISKHSAHSTSLPVGFRTLLWRYTCLLLLISMLWHRQAIFELKGDKLSSSAECRIQTQGFRHLFASRLNACWQTDWAIEDQAKTLTRQPVPMISKHSAHSTSLSVGFRTWLWRYICLLLLISELWNRQAIFELKGDKLSSSAECRMISADLFVPYLAKLNSVLVSNFVNSNRKVVEFLKKQPKFINQQKWYFYVKRYHDICKYVCTYKQKEKQWNNNIHYIEFTDQLLIKTSSRKMV